MDDPEKAEREPHPDDAAFESESAEPELEILKAARGIGSLRETGRRLAQLQADASSPLRALGEEWALSAARLRDIAESARNIQMLPYVPPTEERIPESSRRTSEQIAQLADIAGEMLTQVAAGVVSAAELRAEMASAAKDARRSGRIIIVLTVVIAVLTYFLVAEALPLPPFPAGGG